MTTTDKAVILARGLGTRMRREEGESGLDAQQRSVADTGVKALIPVGRPFLDYVLSGLCAAGFRRVCLVVAPDHAAIREYYEEQAPPTEIGLEYAVQVEPRGTADAVAAAEAFAGDDSVIVLNSDNYYPAEALTALHLGDGSAAALFEQETMMAQGNIAPERLRSFAVGRIDAAGRLERILEKPDEATLASLPRPLWVSMNCWRFRPSIFEACRNIGPSPRGELELTDAVQYSVDRLGERFQVVPVRAAVLDMTSRKDIGPVKEKLAGMEVRY